MINKKNLAELILRLPNNQLEEYYISLLKSIASSSLDWRIFFELILRNKLLSFLDFHLKQYDITSEIIYLYDKIIQSELSISKLVNEKYLELVEQFNSANFKYCVIKGISLNERLYKKLPGNISRPFNDLDLLVLNSDLKSIENYLEDFGFTQSYHGLSKRHHIVTQKEKLWYKLYTHQIYPYEKKIQISQGVEVSLVVDVNFTIFFGGSIHDPILRSDILEDIQNYTCCSGNTFYVLNEGKELLQLCVHYYKDIFYEEKKLRKKPFVLLKLVDLYLYIEKYISDEGIGDFIWLINIYNLTEMVKDVLQYVDCIWKGKTHDILKRIHIEDYDEIITRNLLLNSIIDMK